MKTRIALLTAAVFPLATAAFAVDLPKIGASTKTRIGSNVGVRTPRATVRGSTRIQAGAKVGPSGVRAGVNSGVRGATRVGQGGVQANGSSQTSVEARGRGSQNDAQPQDNGAPRDARHRPQTWDQVLRARMRTYFGNEKARIEYMRDIAVERNDPRLLDYADALESRLRNEMQRRSLELEAQIRADQRLRLQPNSLGAQGQIRGAASGRIPRQARRREDSRAVNPQPTTGPDGDRAPQTETQPAPQN